jgi:hypothetical protein
MISVYSKMFKYAGLVFLSFSRLPDDGTPVTKHVDVNTHHELYFMTCTLLYLSVHLSGDILNKKLTDKKNKGGNKHALSWIRNYEHLLNQT